ncbi:MAG: hypothetical protein ACLFSB_13050 [Chitinispirillaceae bacterium]
MDMEFHSLNHFSHRELYKFSRRLIAEYERFRPGPPNGESKRALSEKVKSGVDEYGSLIENIYEKSIALLLDDFEKRRYKIWQQILSFLDRQLQVKVDPFDDNWDGKTPEKQLLRHIPTYNAAHFLLYEMCPSFTHYGRKLYGYVHTRKEMDTLIQAMQSAQAARAVETLGIGDKLKSYMEVKDAFDFCICRYSQLKQIFEQLSYTRVRVCLGVVFLLHRLPRYSRSFPLFRNVTVRQISPLLVPRKELFCTAQRLSFNDFSHRNLLILAQRMLQAREQRIENGLDDLPLAGELQNQVNLFEKVVQTIFTDMEEKEFDQEEGQRYRLFELLISTIEQHLQGDVERSCCLWGQPGCSSRYEAAEYLLYDSCEDYTHDFNPEGNGHMCQSSLMDMLTESWAGFDAQMALKKLGCTDLYNQYREIADKCEKSAWRIDRRVNFGITSALRNYRFEISLLVTIAARHLGRNSVECEKKDII